MPLEADGACKSDQHVWYSPDTSNRGRSVACVALRVCHEQLDPERWSSLCTFVQKLERSSRGKGAQRSRLCMDSLAALDHPHDSITRKTALMYVIQ